MARRHVTSWSCGAAPRSCARLLVGRKRIRATLSLVHDRLPLAGAQVPIMLYLLRLEKHGWTWAHACMFGAMVASTDAVAIVSIMKTSGHLLRGRGWDCAICARRRGGEALVRRTAPTPR